MQRGLLDRAQTLASAVWLANPRAFVAFDHRFCGAASCGFRKPKISLRLRLNDEARLAASARSSPSPAGRQDDVAEPRMVSASERCSDHSPMRRGHASLRARAAALARCLIP